MKMTKRAMKNFKKRRLLQKDKYPSPTDYSQSTQPEEGEPKGMPGGRCNVTSCQWENSAIFLNVGQIGGKHPYTGGCYYCVDCATRIHESNKPFSEVDHMTLFPSFDEMMARYMDLYRSIRDGSIGDHLANINDIKNYSDIDQNPWGSCHHFDRDKYLEKQDDTNRTA